MSLINTINRGDGTSPSEMVVKTVPTEADIPPGVTGFYFVTNSIKGDSQMYLVMSGVRFWIAMVRD